MKRIIASGILSCFLVGQPTHVQAQTVSPFSSPDRELWEAMGRGFGDISMPLAAHQAIQSIMANVQREAQMREARAKAKPIEAPKEEK